MRHFLPLAITISVGVSTSIAEQPNFVVIMADDMGYGDLGCYGATAYETPNIDRMAREGMRFTDFHSSGAVCSPTRAGLLTGRYQQRAGVPGVIYAAFQRNRHHGLQLQEVTFAEVLREAGYSTGMSGKWHLGYQEQYNPTYQGFERFAGYVSGNVDFQSHFDGSGVFDWWHQNELSDEAGYTTHLITKHAVQFIREHADGPFCLYVAHEAPHYPYQGPDDDPVRDGKTQGDLWNHFEPSHAQTAYAEMMVEFDRGVGGILSTLKELNLDQNTVVMVFSDNGGIGPCSNGELFGMKATLWEGGIRVPCIARWPGRIPAGAKTDQLAITLDVMPTLLELASIDATDMHLDGMSLAPTLLESAEPTPRQLFWAYNQQRAMRDGDWKLVLNGNRPPKNLALHPNTNWQSDSDERYTAALFDLSSDPGERTPQSDQVRMDSMTTAIAAWETDVATGQTAQPSEKMTP